MFDADAGTNNIGDGIERANFVKSNFLGRFAVDFSLGNGNPLENGEGVRFDKRAQIARFDEAADFSMAAPVGMGVVLMFMMLLFTVLVIVVMAVMVSMMMPVLVFGFVPFVVVDMMMLMPVLVAISAATARFILIVAVGCPLVDAEFDASNGLPLLALEVHVEIAQSQLGEFPFEGGGLDAEVAQRANGHVAADAGYAVEKKDAHGDYKNRKQPARKGGKTLYACWSSFTSAGRSIFWS